MNPIRAVLEEYQKDSQQNFLCLKETDSLTDSALLTLSEVVRAEKKWCKHPNCQECPDGPSADDCCYELVRNQTLDHISQLILKG